ncbi:MAG: DUF799 domain-containing protein [Pseudomonadota bacterium]
MIKAVYATLALLMLAGCATPPPQKDLSAFQAAAPRSILIVPVVNKSLDVDAPNYVLATLPTPVAEKGYYTFPVHTTKYILEQEGLYEGEKVHEQPPESLAKLFDADAILYVTIHRWDAQYALITTTVTVDFEYRMVDKHGNALWHEKKTMVYTPQTNNSGSVAGMLLSAVINAAITRAAPNYLPLTQAANRQVFHFPPTAIPDGPYRQSETGKK